MNKAGQFFIFLLIAFVVALGTGISLRLEVTTLSFLGGTAVGALFGALVTLMLVFVTSRQQGLPWVRSDMRGASVYTPSPTQAQLYWTPLLPPAVVPPTQALPNSSNRQVDYNAGLSGLGEGSSTPAPPQRRFFVIGDQGEETELRA